MRVIIFFQHRVREWQACVRLAENLRRRGVEATIYNIDFEWARAVRDAVRHGIDGLVMPWMYHDSNYLLLAPFLRFNPRLIVVNLHQEQLGTPISLRMILPKGEDAKNSVLHYVWGDHFRRELEAVGVRQDLITVTGNMRNDAVATTLLDKTELATRYGLDPHKRWVLIAESRGWVRSYTPAFRADLIRQGYTASEADEFIDVTRRSLDAAVAELDSLPPDFLPECELIYRAHPGTLADDFSDPRVHAIAGESIHDWLANIDLIVVWTSTTIYEAELHGVPGVVWSPVPNPPQHTMTGLDRFPQIQHLTELTDVLAVPQQATRHFVDLLGPDDGHCVERVADALLGDLERPPADYRARPAPLSLDALRKLAFELATRAAMRTGILRRFRWPRSAYTHRSDIPGYGDHV